MTEQERRDPVCRIVLEINLDVRVGVGGDADVRVSQAVAHHLEGDAKPETTGGVEMPQVVDVDAGQSGTGDGVLEGVVGHGFRDWPSVLFDEDGGRWVRVGSRYGTDSLYKGWGGYRGGKSFFEYLPH